MPRSLSICDVNNKNTDTVTDQDGYYIHVVAEIRKPDPRIGFALAFYDDADNMLFVSELYDSFPAEDVSSLNGVVEFEVPMPKGIFLSLGYSVELLSYLHYTGWILPARNISRIHFNYLSTAQENWYSGSSRLGKMLIPMRWNIKGSK